MAAFSVDGRAFPQGLNFLAASSLAPVGVCGFFLAASMFYQTSLLRNVSANSRGLNFLAARAVATWANLSPSMSYPKS